MNDKKSKNEENLGYENARKKLLEIVNLLENEENTNLEESIKLWEEGNKLATFCKKYLQDAQNRLEKEN
jgi:exodeoxyribonuclease VII small subunit